MSLGALNARLLSVAELVGQGAVFADIGTDHAHLPIFLLREKRIERAVCSDINKGPLESAKRNAEESGLLDKMEFVLTDGAAALSGKGINCYAICGMGGELIAEIVDKAPELKNPGVSLILQPMTKQAHLRKFLAENGFCITLESYSSEGHRHYVAMLVSYTGKRRTLTETEAETGTNYLNFVNIDSQIAYLEGKIKSTLRMVEGKKQSGSESSAEEELLAGLREALLILKNERK